MVLTSPASFVDLSLSLSQMPSKMIDEQRRCDGERWCDEERRRDEARWRDEERWCDEECMNYEVMRDVVPMGNASPAYLYMDAWPVPKHCKKQEY